MDTIGSLASAALLVVDMQNDFIDGSLTVLGAAAIIARVNFWIEVFEDLGQPLLYSLDWHPAQTPHFDRWPVHCVAGSEGARVHPDVIYEPMEMANVVTILKGMGQDDGYSACSQSSDVFNARDKLDYTSTQDSLARLGVDTVLVVGVATDHCVRATVLDLLKLGLTVIVITDAVAGVDEKASAAALGEMEAAGARLALEERLLPTRVDSSVLV